ARLIDSLRRPDEAGSEAPLLSLGRALLGEQVHALESAAAADLNDYANLHQVRIKGKRLRYTMEVFADWFPPAFRAHLYSQVEEMQDVLGKANDSHVAASRLGALRDRLRRASRGEWKRLQPGFNALLGFHRRRLPQERRRFLKLWTRWRRPETIDLWESML